MIDQLLGYDAIGWDFDGTLVDHPKSPLMHEFINSQPNKQHVILTFRTHGMETTMFREMRQKYPTAPLPRQFTTIRNINARAWEKFIATQEGRLLGRYHGPLTPWEEYYIQWKGMECGRLGLPVLVDDMPEHVLPGCEKYGITYLHPDDL
jgi:hypothetical protein